MTLGFDLTPKRKKEGRIHKIIQSRTQTRDKIVKDIISLYEADLKNNNKIRLYCRKTKIIAFFHVPKQKQSILILIIIDIYKIDLVFR